MLDHRQKAALRGAMTQSIAGSFPDPNSWNTIARGIAEALGLNVARIEFYPVLELTCGGVLEEASKQERLPEEISAVISASVHHAQAKELLSEPTVRRQAIVDIIRAHEREARALTGCSFDCGHAMGIRDVCRALRALIDMREE